MKRSHDKAGEDALIVHCQGEKCDANARPQWKDAGRFQLPSLAAMLTHVPVSYGLEQALRRGECHGLESGMKSLTFRQVKPTQSSKARLSFRRVRLPQMVALYWMAEKLVE